MDSLTLIGYQNRISAHNINTTSNRKVMRKKEKHQSDLIPYTILENKTIRIVWQTAIRFDTELLALEGLRVVHTAHAALKNLLSIELDLFF